MLKKYLIPSLVSIVFFFAYSQISLRLYHSHQTRGDLTAYAQGMWNTLNGHFMASTYNYSVHNYYDKQYREINSDNSNIFGVHFNPVLLLFIPFYGIAQSPETLLFIQSLLTAFGGFIIYCLAKKILRSNLLAIIIQFSYLIYFATISATLSQFHAYTLALFFAPILILASTQKNNVYYYLSLAMFLLVQENTSLVALFFGLYLIIRNESRKKGIVTVLTSLLYFTLTIYYIIPSLSPYHFYLFSGIYGSNLGGNISEMIKNSFLDPKRLFQTIFTKANIDYIRNLLVGILPFSLLSPLVLLVAFSSLAQNILSSSLGLKTQLMHYESGAVAFLFYALILGINYFLTQTKIGKTKYSFIACISVVIIMTSYSYKIFTSHRFNPTLLSLNLYNQKDSEMDELINMIPVEASVSTQDYLSAQLSNREGLYQFPVYIDQVDYVLISKSEATWPLTVEEQQAFLSKLRTSQSHTVIKETTNFVLFGQSPHP